MDDFGLTLKGADVAAVVNYFTDGLKEFLRSYLLGKLTD